MFALDLCSNIRSTGEGDLAKANVYNYLLVAACSLSCSRLARADKK